MKKIISAHNKKVLATKKPPIPLEEEQVITNCNCSERTPPMPYCWHLWHHVGGTCFGTSSL